MLTTLKRFEFSAAHAHGGHLHGHNFILWVGITGALNTITGMVINITDLKTLVNQALDRYDHRNLDKELGPSETPLPHIAAALWHDLTPLLPHGIGLQSLELREEAGPGVVITASPQNPRNPFNPLTILYAEFAAAHRTHAPQLSAADNLALYGKCNRPSGHGHNYWVEFYLRDQDSLPLNFWDEFDHHNLSTDIPELQGHNVVTETIAALLACRVPAAVRVRVWEMSDFFAEYDAVTAQYQLGRRYTFSAAHRLNSLQLSAAENQALYGKCNRPEPHGHTYQLEVSVQGALDPRTETVYDLVQLDAIATKILRPLNHVFLDADVPAFQAQPSTGENIVHYLWDELQRQIPQLVTVRLWETPNNQFVVSR